MPFLLLQDSRRDMSVIYWRHITSGRIDVTLDYPYQSNKT